MIQHAGSHDRDLYPPKFDDRSEEETLLQERCFRRDAWKMTKRHFQSQKQGHSYVLLASEVWKRICWGFPRLNAHTGQERYEFSWTGDCSSIQKSNNGYYSQWRSADKWGSSSVRPRFRDAPVLSLGKQCEHHGYSDEWASGQKSHPIQNGEWCKRYFVILRHGRTCDKNVLNGIGKQSNRAIVQVLHTMSWQSSERKIGNGGKFVKRLVPNCLEILVFGTYW